MSLDNGQPTAVVYRTTKGWQYGIEGKASHGAGHKLCCAGFYEALQPLTDRTGAIMPSCHGTDQTPGGQDTRCRSGAEADIVEGVLLGSPVGDPRGARETAGRWLTCSRDGCRRRSRA